MWIQTESSNQDFKKQEKEREKIKVVTLYKTINTGTFTKWGNGNS